MNFEFAREVVQDAYYQRLCRDLEHKTRKRRINRHRFELVMAVRKLPEIVPEKWRATVPQWMLERAHEMANLIESHLHSKWLEYDFSPKVILLHGSYGSRQ